MRVPTRASQEEVQPRERNVEEDNDVWRQEQVPRGKGDVHKYQPPNAMWCKQNHHMPNHTHQDITLSAIHAEE